MQEIQIEELLRIGERVVRPQPRELPGERATEADIESSQSLLAINDGSDSPVTQRTCGGTVGIVALMVITHEVVESETAGVALFDVPHEKGADGVPTHEAVKEPSDLVARP
nr:hypothetical protein [Actinacidiphila soli]